ncbi:MAG: glycoside hydrolase family 32 protein [Ginsengibacter sp.]
MKKLLLFLLLCVLISESIFAQETKTPTPQWRPVYHFTPLKNWTNDPNGLIYIDGVYHLYNQQNPYENKWGHMSWGHAISTDLVHWKHLPLAMPEAISNRRKDTTWRYSGSAVLDQNNTSSLCKNGACIVAIYTAHQPDLKKESQYIAYSNDGGLHFTQYAGNPVIDLNMRDFRDPSVEWNQQLKKWLMVVALPMEHKVQFYSSGNLKNWDLLSEFGPAGLIDGGWECPSFFQLPVKGDPGKKKWVLMTSFGSHYETTIQYFIGDFDGKTFTNDNPVDSIFRVDEGDCFYAAIPWNNVPDDKKIFIGWLRPPPQETYPWRGQMSIPRNLSLRETAHGIRLFQEPASLIRNNLSKLSENHVIKLKNVHVEGAEVNIFKRKAFRSNSYWLEADMEIKPNSVAGFKIAQKKDDAGKLIEETEIGYDVVKHQLYVDRTHSRVGRIRGDKSRQTADVMDSNGKIKLEILFDKSSLEIFVNDGEKVLSTHVFPGKDADWISAFSGGGSTLIKFFTIWNLSNLK